MHAEQDVHGELASEGVADGIPGDVARAAGWAAILLAAASVAAVSCGMALHAASQSRPLGERVRGCSGMASTATESTNVAA